MWSSGSAYVLAIMSVGLETRGAASIRAFRALLLQARSAGASSALRDVSSDGEAEALGGLTLGTTGTVSVIYAAGWCS